MRIVVGAPVRHRAGRAALTGADRRGAGQCGDYRVVDGSPLAVGAASVQLAGVAERAGVVLHLVAHARGLEVATQLLGQGEEQ